MKKFIFVFIIIACFNSSFAGVLFKPKVVLVNETADNVVNAKKIAFSKAKKTAWLDLVGMVGVTDRNDIINISENDMDSMIENIDVSGEKARAKRYIANITVYFNPNKIRSYFRNNNINFLELNLFHFQDEAVGMVFWHPKGWSIYRELEEYIRRKITKGGYQEIKNLKGRRAYEEKKASKLGFTSLYAYFEDKILKKKKAEEDIKKELEETKIENNIKSKQKKSCGCC